MSTQQDVLGGGALAEVARPLKDFFEKLGGDDGEQWLVGFKRFLRKENTWNPAVIHIDRTKPFHPVNFLGKGWKIVEQDERALALAEVDLSAVVFETFLMAGENFISGEERIRRMKNSSRVRLDAKIFQTLWENKKLILEHWKKKRWIYFDGTILLGPDGRRYALCLFLVGDAWRWRYSWLGVDRSRGPSALLASISN